MPTPSSPHVVTLDDLAVLIPDHADTSSLSQQAYYLLRDRIVTLQLPPGTLVNERELAQDSGLGRTPVRDALRRLADENLVEIYPRRGVYVGAIDAGDLRAISEVRIELEAFISRLAAIRATAADYPAIDGLLSELHAVTDDTDQRTLIRLDQRIHRLIYQLARNDYLHATLDRYYVLALRLWFLALARVHQLTDAVREHTDLLDAIRRGDADAAARVARDHVIEFDQQIRQLL